MPAEKDLSTSPSGLKYQVLVAGAGPRPKITALVTVHYTGWLTDGTRFDSTHERGRPATIALTEVIRGLSEGLQLMSPGATYKLVIPGPLAYPNGRPPLIPPGAT